MLEHYDILETLKMLEQEHLDIRTVTMGISLVDCACEDTKRFCDNIYDKITTSARDLVPKTEEIEKKYGIPIINKRVAVTPISIAAAACKNPDFPMIAKTLDRAAAALGINFIGGFSALVHKGFTDADRRLIDAIPESLAQTQNVCSSVNVATTRAGINMDAIARMGEIVKQTADLTADRDSIGCAKLVVFANAPEDNPFMAGAFHGVGEPERVINVGVSGPAWCAAPSAARATAILPRLRKLLRRLRLKLRAWASSSRMRRPKRSASPMES